MTDDRVDVLLVATPGGHLQELYALRAAWDGMRTAWVTLDMPDVGSLLKDERVYFAAWQSPTHQRTLPINFVKGLRLIGKLRPKAVVTAGAALAVPFCWAAKVRGVPVVFVESATRIDHLSRSGRLIAPVADRIYAQWPELTETVPRAVYVGNLFWDA